MKVSILNNQTKVKVAKPLRDIIRQAAKASAITVTGHDNFEVSVMLTDDFDIQTLNSLHRNMDKPTDVLSFPLVEWCRGEPCSPARELTGDLLSTGEHGSPLLGDIVISLERAQAQAEEYGHSFEREVGFLTVHSMLHLFGYDHVADETEMFALQDRILEEMGLNK